MEQFSFRKCSANSIWGLFGVVVFTFCFQRLGKESKTMAFVENLKNLIKRHLHPLHYYSREIEKNVLCFEKTGQDVESIRIERSVVHQILPTCFMFAMALYYTVRLYFDQWLRNPYLRAIGDCYPRSGQRHSWICMWVVYMAYSALRFYALHTTRLIDYRFLIVLAIRSGDIRPLHYATFGLTERQYTRLAHFRHKSLRIANKNLLLFVLYLYYATVKALKANGVFARSTLIGFGVLPVAFLYVPYAAAGEFWLEFLPKKTKTKQNKIYFFQNA